MGNYLKLFNNHNEYTAFTQTDEFVKPNVSHCITENEVHYNGIVEPLVIAYQIDSDYLYVKPYYCYGGCGETYFEKIEIDGVEIPITYIDEYGRYEVSTAGDHTVSFILKDPTAIPDVFGLMTSKIKSITLPKSIITIEDGTFCEDDLDADSKEAIKAINPYGVRSCEME